MTKKHIVELLVEVNKKITNTINKIEHDEEDEQHLIDELNDTIRQLDKIVEQLEK